MRVLEVRGRAMQAACEETQGAMLSVMGLGQPVLEEICAAAGVELANLNAADQMVLSGKREGILLAEAQAKGKGAKRTVVLNVAGAYHSSLMASAAVKLEQTLAGIRISEPTMPVMSNVTGRPHENAEAIRHNMVRQVTNPVQWIACTECFRSSGIAEYVEFGPGKVLSGLVKRIDKESSTHNIQDQLTLQKTIEAIGLG